MLRIGTLALMMGLCTGVVDAHVILDEQSSSAAKISSKAKRQHHQSASSAADPWHTIDSLLSPAYAANSNVSILIDGPYRVIRSDGIPDHSTGQFPNRGNPNTISQQNYVFRMAKDPVESGSVIPLGMYPFGVALNGIPFDPGAAEWWHRDPSSGWQYEAMALGPRLGLDANNAHVQPGGAYHYHGPPTGLLQRLEHAGQPVMIGFAADGFPIYCLYGYANAKDKNSGLRKLRSSYRLKSGDRPDGPGGRYDGSFVQDYEYTRGSGDLDECNGRHGVTPEYPGGTYYYVITDAFPFIPRAFKGTPDTSFRTRGGTRRGPGGPMRSQFPPPFGRPPFGGGPPGSGFPGPPPFPPDGPPE